MPEGPDGKTIIVVKKVTGHAGHHGGAWKVAYADFVTAMMALFMVLWLVNSASVTTRERIASYFRRPGVFLSGSGTPLEMGGAGILPDTFAPTTAGNSSITPTRKIYDVQGLSQGKFREGFGHGEGTEAGDELKIAQLERMARDIYRAIGSAGGDISGETGAGKGAGAMLPRDQTGDWNGEIKFKPMGPSGSSSTSTLGKMLGTGELEGSIGPGHAKGLGVPGAKGMGAGEGAGQGPASAEGKGMTGAGGELAGGIAKGAGEDLAGTGTSPDGNLAAGLGGKGAEEVSDEPVEIKPPSGGEGDGTSLGDVEIKVDQSGLHIEIMDTATVSMFKPGSAEMSIEAQQALQKVAGIILGLPNATLAIEGHTDAIPYKGGPFALYTNWELSADRANAARHVLQLAGIKDAQITGVSGLGSQKLKVPENPSAPANRRITISLQYSPEAEQALQDKLVQKPKKKGKDEGEELKPGQTDSDVLSPEEIQNTVYDLEALGIDLTKPDWIFGDQQKLLYYLGMLDVLPAEEQVDSTQDDITIEDVPVDETPSEDALSESTTEADEDIQIEEVDPDAKLIEAPVAVKEKAPEEEVIDVTDKNSSSSSSSSGIPYIDDTKTRQSDWNDKQQIFNNDSSFFGDGGGRR